MSRESSNIPKKELEQFKKGEEETKDLLKANWEKFQLEKELEALGIDSGLVEALDSADIADIGFDLEGVEERLGEVAFNSQRLEDVERTIEELEQDEDEARETMVLFRLEQLQEAYNRFSELKEELDNQYQKLSPSKVQDSEIEKKIEETEEQIEQLEQQEDPDQTRIRQLRLKKQTLQSKLSDDVSQDSSKTLPAKRRSREVRRKIDQLEEEMQDLRNSNPEAFMGLNHREFRRLSQNLDEGQIAETRSVEKRIEKIMTHLEANIPVFLYGHFGSGKTETAAHIAETRFPKTEEQEERGVPDSYIISGSKHLMPSELYGHQTLTVSEEGLSEEGLSEQKVEQWENSVEQVEEEFNSWLEEELKEWKEENPKKDEEDFHEEMKEEKQRKHEALLRTHNALIEEGGGTVSEYVMGPVYEAMKEGRPLIIDEVNAIPHEVLISLNHILTREAGDKLTIQQDSNKEIEIQDGFCVMMTGNLNQGSDKYVDRQELDPAFLSRLYRMEWDYLPQKDQGSLEQEAGPENELFQLLVAKMADEDGNIVAPENGLNQVWEMAKTARTIQNVFSGKQVDKISQYEPTSGPSIEYTMEKTNLTPRKLFRILDVWEQEDSDMSLDEYVYSEFISQITDPIDKAYVYQLFNTNGFFQEEDGWDRSKYPNPSNPSGPNPTFEVESPGNKGNDLKFYGPREVIQAVYGDIPEREEWPEEIRTEASDREKIREREEMMGEIDEIIKDAEQHL